MDKYRIPIVLAVLFALLPGLVAQAAAPSLGALQAARSMIPDVAHYDREAHMAQARLSALSHKTQPAFLEALDAYEAAEAALDTARDAAWSAIPSLPASVTLIHEPLLLAMLDLHIALRRRLGPTYRTVVPGLTADRGCSGDLIGERLIYVYGAAAANPLSGPGNDTRAVLDKMARQVVCLGAQQLATLEYAIAASFEHVVDRLAAHGLGELIPAFARLVAPVQVLILDARKHRGEASRAWQWFVIYGSLIRDDVAGAGWASGELLVWDRRQGSLVGFPSCAPGTLAPDCVDLQTFLDSILEPRALGLGDCAFAGMLSRPTDAIEGEERYTCPVRECEAPTETPCFGGVGSTASIAGSCGSTGSTFATPGASGAPGDGAFLASRGWKLPPEQLDQLRSTWSQLGDSDLALMGQFCRGAQTDSQGVNFNLDSCINFNPDANNPFEQHTACMVEALGRSEAPQIGGELRGVPRGPHCGLTDPESDVTPTGTDPEQPDAEEEKPDDKQQDPHQHDNCDNGGSCAITDGSGSGTPTSTPPASDSWCDWCKAVADWFANLLGVSASATDGVVQNGAKGLATARQATGGVSNGAGAIVGVELQLLSKEGAEAQLGAAEGLSDAALKGALLDGSITTEQFYQLRDMKPADRVEALNKLQGNGAQDCLDPGACSNNCTGLGQQISEATACTEDLLDSLANALGLPDKKDLKRRLDIVSYPRPDADTSGEDSGIGACLDDNTPSRPSMACGLMLCADGWLATGSAGGCDCGQNTPAFIPQHSLCTLVRCADGTLPGPECTCQPAEASEPLPLPPGPGPMHGLELGASPMALPQSTAVQADLGPLANAAAATLQQLQPLSLGQQTVPGDRKY